MEQSNGVGMAFFAGVFVGCSGVASLGLEQVGFGVAGAIGGKGGFGHRKAFARALLFFQFIGDDTLQADDFLLEAFGVEVGERGGCRIQQGFDGGFFLGGGGDGFGAGRRIAIVFFEGPDGGVHVGDFATPGFQCLLSNLIGG